MQELMSIYVKNEFGFMLILFIFAIISIDVGYKQINKGFVKTKTVQVNNGFRLLLLGILLFASTLFALLT